MSRFWIAEPGQDNFREVAREQYVAAERQHGFTNTMGRPDQPATSSFTALDGTRGTTLLIEPEGAMVSRPTSISGEQVDGFDPHHWYYDRRGQPITLQQWATYREDEQYRTLRSTEMALADRPLNSPIRLVTMYLGMVCPEIYDARLFGTAIIADCLVGQIEVHDTEAEAALRHHDHTEAIRNGFHCARCKDGLPHHD